MSAERREAIAERRARPTCAPIEDDVYGPLVPDRAAGLRGARPGAHALPLERVEVPGPRAAARFPARAGRPRPRGHGGPARAVARHARWRRSCSRARTGRRRGRSVGAAAAEMVERQKLAVALLAGLDTRAKPTALHVWLARPIPGPARRRSPWRSRGGRARGASRAVLHRPRSRRAQACADLAFRAADPPPSARRAPAGGGGPPVRRRR